jgi:tetratricopeptide (TPR) repeat protein
MGSVASLEKTRKPIINPDLFPDDDGGSSSGSADDATSEQALVELVEQKMLEKRARERRDEEQRIQQLARRKLAELQQQEQKQASSSLAAAPTSSPRTTTGVGGSWTPPAADGPASGSSNVEYYKPKSGSWGAFPRPKDISQAYGGGRRIGPGFSNESERLQSEQDTRDRLQRYRERVGIDVKSEREHAGEIDEALRIANYAMQRGRYSAGVSALEKVTRYCSTNSKVGGKVFLELAMAYEAVGRTDEAILVYRELSTSRIEDVKFDAKRLLYGLEAMQFMQNDVKSPEFNKRRARNTFIDTTGFGNIASHFDDVYQTAYVDLEGGFYKKLTESVVRSTREARQILLRATEAGEVPRLRVVQALRSISRSFDDALESEIKRSSAPEQPVAVINGVPILSAAAAATGIESTATPSTSFSSSSDRLSVSDEFTIMDPPSMMANLNGEWKLQLLADKRGDGVKYFNNAVAWQSIDSCNGTFSSCGPSGFSTVQNAGFVEFNDKRRILRRRGVQETGGGVGGLLPPFLLGGAIGGSRGGFASAVRSPQQVMSVDSILLITRGIPNRRVRQADDGEKDYFAVWRRVEGGTDSSPSSLAGNSRT